MDIRNTGQLVQSTLPLDKPGRLQALVFESGLVVAQYSRDSTTGSWKRDLVVSPQAKFSTCLIQSNYGETRNNSSNFKAVVVEGLNLVHYSRNNAALNSSWQRGDIISRKCQGPASLIQVWPFGISLGIPGNFEVAVFEENQLVLYTRDNGKAKPTWTKGAVISPRATGPVALIQNRFPGSGVVGGMGNYELVVLEKEGLVHYYRDNHALDTPWIRGQIISS